MQRGDGLFPFARTALPVDGAGEILPGGGRDRFAVVGDGQAGAADFHGNDARLALQRRAYQFHRELRRRGEHARRELLQMGIGIDGEQSGVAASQVKPL